MRRNNTNKADMYVCNARTLLIKLYKYVYGKENKKNSK